MTGTQRIPEQQIQVAIRNRLRAIAFPRYADFLDKVLATPKKQLEEFSVNHSGIGAYELLKLGTEVFLLVECGVLGKEAHCGEPILFEDLQNKLKEYLGSPPQLPYITRLLMEGLPGHDRLRTEDTAEFVPIELVWSYWLEEGMLTQTMAAVVRRFQNASGTRDSLAQLDLAPLRPVNNLLWGFIQDAPRRLSLQRRSSEYRHTYGLALSAKATHRAESESRVLKHFHGLVFQSFVVFKEDDKDGIPLLNELKAMHLLLPETAHNHFGDTPWIARSEMMQQQYILSRSEVRDFLQSSGEVECKEPWMAQVDTMKTLQHWSSVSVTHFHDVAVYGEQILLSIRYGNWATIHNPEVAKEWAWFWKEALQTYVSGYHAVTGVDLTCPDGNC